MLFRSVGTVGRCKPLADRFRKNGTWWVPTLNVEVPDSAGPKYATILGRVGLLMNTFWYGSDLPKRDWLRTGTVSMPVAALAGVRSFAGDGRDDYLRVVHEAGLPVLAGSDVGYPNVVPGWVLHAELAIFVAEGLTPLEALQSATLNPAKMLHATDSLGTVDQGKLADLVVLSADPLEDITNITLLDAVIANGRYFDRAALDQLIQTGRQP